MKIQLDSLLVLHNSLRNPTKVKELYSKGDINTILVRYPIPIIRIEQIRFYQSHHLHFMRDRHHAATALLSYRLQNNIDLGLNDNEYIIEDYTFTDMWTPNSSVGWVTPFNPVTHVRKCDFMGWKNKMTEYIKQHGDKNVDSIIKDCFDEYAEPREILTLKDMYLKYKDMIHEKTQNLVGVDAHR